jgi:hypothetical protein
MTAEIIALDCPDAAARRSRRTDAPESTYEAIMYSLERRGIGALREPDTRHRLADLSREQIRQAVARLRRQQARGMYPAITNALITLLTRLSDDQ